MAVFNISDYYNEQDFIELFRQAEADARHLAFELIDTFIEQKLHGIDALSTEFMELVRSFTERKPSTQSLIRDFIFRALTDEDDSPLPESVDWTDFSSTLGVALLVLEQGFEAH